METWLDRDQLFMWDRGLRRHEVSLACEEEQHDGHSVFREETKEG